MTDTPSPIPQIQLGGKHYHLHPTLEDLRTIEQKLATSLLALARKLADGVISLEELFVVLEHSVEAEARSLHVRELALRAGISHIMESVTGLMLHLLQGRGPHNPTGASAKEQLATLAAQFPDQPAPSAAASPHT